MSSSVRFSVLGPLSCEFDRRRVNLGGAKQQMVLALLLLEANSVVSVDKLLDWVWPESDGGGGSPSTLQVYVSNLRRLLAEAMNGSDRVFIATERPGYRMSLDDGELDLLEFQSLVRSSADPRSTTSPADTSQALLSALGLWRGECLSGLPVDASNSSVTTAIEGAKTTARERLAQAELDLGHHREVLAELQEWVGETPHDEQLRAHLMLALYRCGRQADALACFKQGRELLVEELGIDPSRQLRELEEKILNQDPTLDFEVKRVDLFNEEESTRLRESALRTRAHVEVNGTSHPLEGSVTTIGRLSDRDIILADVGVSRRHCELRRSGNSFRMVDSGSSNGTEVNGRRVSDAVLSDGDEVRVGDTVLVFRCEPW